MRKRVAATVIAVSALAGGAAGGAAAYYQDFLLAPLRAEQVAPPESGPSFWPARNTLQQEPCRYWLGFSC